MAGSDGLNAGTGVPGVTGAVEVVGVPVGVGVFSSFAALARSTAVPSARVILIALDLVRGTKAFAEACRLAEGELMWPGVKG